MGTKDLRLLQKASPRPKFQLLPDWRPSRHSPFSGPSGVYRDRSVMGTATRGGTLGSVGARIYHLVMRDAKKWRIALAEFEGMRAHLPSRVSEKFVSDYHAVLNKMADASEEDIDSFRIPANELKPIVVSVQLESFGSPRTTQHSKDNYCDTNLFQRKIDALARYLPSIEERMRQPRTPDDSKDYWSMSTPQLERLAAKFGIEGYGDQHGHVDRDIIIKGLLQRDAALQSPRSHANLPADFGSDANANLRQTSRRTPQDLKPEAAADTQLPISFEEKPNPPKVFISYSHDSKMHLSIVLRLSDRLRSEGVDCHIDQYEESPPQGWPSWCEKQVREADFVLVACTEIYLRRFQGEEETGKGLGVIWEGHIITQELYNAQGRNKKFVPIMFSSEDEVFIPTPLQGASHYHLPERYDDLYRRLTGQPLIPKPPLGAMKPMPSVRMPALQALKPRESFFAYPTETFSQEETIRSGGEQLYNDLIAANFISHSVGASRTIRELIEELAANSNKPIPIDSIRATFGEQRTPRGSVFFGNPGNHLEDLLSAYPKVRWWISSRGLNVEEERPSSEVSERSKEQPTPPAARGIRPQQNPMHNVVFLSAAFVKIAYSGPGYSRRTDGMHSFSEVEGASKGDMIGLVARFRNEAIYGHEITTVRAVRAHLKLFDQNNQEIGTGYSSALWLGHPGDTLDLVPNGRAGSVLVCWGSKTRARVSWKTRVAIDRLRDNDTELRDGYPSRAEVTLMDSNHRPLVKPIVLEITKTAGELSVVARQLQPQT